jgi:hypothetical protein
MLDVKSIINKGAEKVYNYLVKKKSIIPRETFSMQLKIWINYEKREWLMSIIFYGRFYS